MRLTLFSLLAMALAAIACQVLAEDTVVVWSEGPGYTLYQGDTNGDLARDMSDAVYLLGYLFLGGPEPAQIVSREEGTPPNGDVNGDGQLDLSDGIFLLDWLYLGGLEPISTDPRPGGGATTVITDVDAHFPVTPPPRFNICNGDTITLSGEATRVSQTIIQPDGSFYTKLVIRWASLTGTGTPSGTQYTVTGGVVLVFEDLAPGMTLTNTAQERYITNDGSPNELVNLVFHVTRNANGELTAAISDLSFECTGS